MVAADFNGDGIPDIAAVDDLNSVLDIFLGDPNHPGQFAQSVSVTISSNVAGITTADFNGDGIPDIALLTPNDINALQILLGDPANPGQFKPAIGYSFPGSAQALNLAVGDLNGDGLPDVIAGGPNITIFLNNPASPGQFLAASQTGLKSYSSLFIADVNGDGPPDIITEDTYLPGDPANPGQFLAPVSLNFGNSEQLEAVADTNGDGLPDLVVFSGPSLLANSLQILLNNPSNPGQFIPNTPAAFNGVQPSQVIAADVNGDGIVDLILDVRNGSLPGSVSLQSASQVFLGDASNPGEFVAQPVQPYLYLLYYAMADFNGDGLLDFATSGGIVNVSLGANIASDYFANTAVATPGPNVLNVSYSGDSSYASSVSPALTINVPVNSSTVLSASPLTALLGSTVTLTATVSVSGNRAAAGTVQFLDGTSLLGSAQIIGTGTQVGSAILETKLGVGSHTLIAVYSGAPLSSQFGNGSTSAPVMATINGTPNTATSLSVTNPSPGKYNLTADVFTFNQSVAAGSVTFADVAQRVTLGELPLSTAAVRGFMSPVLTPVSQLSNSATFAVGDLNGDGVPDLVLANGGLLVALSNPQNPGTFQNPVYLPGTEFADAVAIADVNGDGVPDLVSCANNYPTQQFGTGSVYVSLGIPGSGGQFAFPTQYPIYNGGCTAINVADLNRDGIADIAALTSSGFLVTFDGNPSQPGTFSSTDEEGVNIETAFASATGQLQVADFNQDGLPDLLVPAGFINLIYGSPGAPGYFQTPINLGTGSFVATADFNGDGIPDIAYAGGSNAITVLLSVPGQPGTFQAAATYTAGNGITGLAVADFNRDGHPDLAVANGSDNTISVLTNDANHPGQFLSQVIYPTAAGPTYIAAADMNGDGFPDLVALDQAGNIEVLLSGLESSVVLSNVTLPGSGYHNLQATFRPPNNRFAAPLGASNSNFVQIVLPSTPSVTLSANPTTAAFGNVVTLLVTVTVDNGITEGVPGGSVEFFDGPRWLGTVQVVISGTALGTATLRTASFGPGTHTITAKFGGALRGRIPVLEATSAPASVTITGLAASATTLSVTPDSSNNANSAFQATVLGFAPVMPTGTVNFVNSTANAVLGSGMVTAGGVVYGSAVTSPVNGSNEPYINTVTGDFNNDGIPDIATLEFGQFAVILSDPQHPGQFLPETDYALNSTTESVMLVAADFNGDGVLDLAVGPVTENGQYASEIGLFLGDPAHPGQFQTPQYITLNSNAEPSQLFAADFNGDGLADLAYFSFGGSVYVSLADPNHPGQFLPAILTQSSVYYSYLAIADVNHDGFPDLVLSSSTSGSQVPTIQVLLSDPSNPGHFIPGASIFAGAGFSSIATADFNGDGLPDILAANSSLVLYPNDPSHPGTFLQPIPASPYVPPYKPTLAIYDLNGDGYPDVLLSRSLILLNNSSQPGHFLPPQAAGASVDAAIADFDSDGVPDLAAFIPNNSNPSATFLAIYAGAITATANLGNIAFTGSAQTIVANYSGDSNFQPSVSNTVTAPLASAVPTTLTLGILPNTIRAGTILMIPAVVSSPNAVPSSGTVQAQIINAAGAATPLSGAGYASLAVPLLTPGTYFISVTYSGTSVWAPSYASLSVTVTGNPQTPLIDATPNPILVPTGSTTGSTSLSWTAPGATTTEVHANSPNGPLVASGGSSNADVAISSVSDGTIFYLQDTSNGKALTLANTLDTVMVHVRSAPVFSATPNPMILANGASTGTTLLQWNAPAGITTVEIHQGSFNGPLIGGGGATGSAAALGIAPGTTFYLQDTTGGKPLSASGTLGIIAVQ